MKARSVAERPCLDVAAAVIRNAQGRMLLAQRPPGKHLAGLWEFPGGKLEPAEGSHEALVRELREELGIEVEHSEPLLSLTHHYPEKSVRLLIRTVDAWHGQAHGLEGQVLDWVSLDEARLLPMPAADRPILQVMALDPRYSLAPDPAASGSPEACLADWKRRLDAGFRLLEFHAAGLDPDVHTRLALDCGALARRAGARWLLNGTPDLAVAAGADGVHLDAAALDSMAERPLSSQLLVAVSCGSQAELDRAAALDLDFVCLSLDLRSDAGHHDSSPDWSAFAAAVAGSPLPVLASGPVRPQDLATAREAGAFGVAGVEGFNAP
jgi:8-oxo-dGTP diphosphatase